MKKILIAVDDTKGSKSVLSAYPNLVRRPEEIVLMHVERIEGRSKMIDMLGEAEISTLKESIKGTEHKAALDRKADKILSFYKKSLEETGAVNIKTLVREGSPAEEIAKVAEAEGTELIILGFTGKNCLGRLITGSVSREIERMAKVPVLVARKPITCEEPYTWRDAYYAASFFTAIFLGLFVLGFVLR